MSITLAALMTTCAPLVHPTTLRALIHVESAGNPYAVSVNRPQALNEEGIDPPEFDPPRDLREALQLTRTLAGQGFTTSVGLAQINIEHLQGLKLRLADLFNPCINLAVAQRILIGCDSAQPQAATPNPRLRLRRTLSCYNAGNFTTGLTNHYVITVTRAALHRARSPKTLRSSA